MRQAFGVEEILLSSHLDVPVQERAKEQMQRISYLKFLSTILSVCVHLIGSKNWLGVKVPNFSSY